MDNKTLTNGLIEADKLVGRGYARLTENAGKAIAIITGIVAALVTFTEVGFGGVDSAAVTPTLLVMLIASYVVYFSMEDAGERYAKSCEEYTAAKAALDKTRGRISGEMMPAFRRFCLEWAAEERRRRAEELLVASGYGTDEYSAYKRGEATSPMAKRVFKRVDRLGQIKISPAAMLSGTEGVGNDGFHSPEGHKLLAMLLRLIPTTLCMLVTVSVFLTGRDGMGAAEIIEGILKLSTLPVVAMKGYVGGYSYVQGPLSGWLEARMRFIEVFLVKWDSGELCEQIPEQKDG